MKMRKELPKGFHHLYAGWVITVGGVIWTFIEFLKRDAGMTFWALIPIGIGFIWAMDDAIKEKWGFFWWLPFSALDRQLKKIPVWFEICFWLDKHFGKEK